MLIKNELKFTENEEFPCFLGPFFDTIFSWKTPIRSREVAAPGTGIFFIVNGHDTRKVYR
jgi:hypothetical protein